MGGWVVSGSEMGQDNPLLLPHLLFGSLGNAWALIGRGICLGARTLHVDMLLTIPCCCMIAAFCVGLVCVMSGSTSLCEQYKI